MDTNSRLSLRQIRVQDSFWSPKMQINSKVTLPIELHQCRITGRVDNFLKAGGKMPGDYEGALFNDSDVYKWIEAAAYDLAADPNPALDNEIDEVITAIAVAQQPDGYLNSYITMVYPDKRFTNLACYHELYCAGHLFEAAVAHHQATGKRSLLDIACRYADCIEKQFLQSGNDGLCGHEEIELGLIRLSAECSEPRYLQLALEFVNRRGVSKRFEWEATHQDEIANREGFWPFPAEYWQNHQPVREQREAVGHAVRACYLYCAMADLAAIKGDRELQTACEAIYADIVSKKLYLTGGIGSSMHNEGFTKAYDLPNQSAYAETCAAIALVFWLHRMSLLTGDSKYADTMEQALYNGVLSGVSLSGDKFFYVNPLASDGSHVRQEWFGCACCPPNIARLMSSLGCYAGYEAADRFTLDLYVGAVVNTDNWQMTIHSEMPWQGRVQLELQKAPKRNATLKLRVPAWAKNARFMLNGDEAVPDQINGYAVWSRNWKAGDIIDIRLDMTVDRVYSHPAVRENQGRVAVMRGPIVYCAEAADQAVPVNQLRLPQSAVIAEKWCADLLGGVMVLHTAARSLATDDSLYPHKMDTEHADMTMIPYFAWDNRDKGPMEVWIPEG